MTTKSTVEKSPTAKRQDAYRARKAEAGLTEVRGVWARPDDHAKIKQYADSMTKRRKRG